MTALAINLTPETLDAGSSYEKATYGLLTIKTHGQILTNCISNDPNGRHHHNGPYISGYHLAEWFAWNWWRLRWEPCPQNDLENAPLDWRMAHSLAAIGEGYIWPNITFSSDGIKCAIASKSSREPDGSRLYYTGASPTTILSQEFEQAVDQFINSILHLAQNAGLGDNNLQNLWHDLTIERQNPEIAHFRRIEALLGLEPDELDEQHLANLLKDATFLNENALPQIAPD